MMPDTWKVGPAKGGVMFFSITNDSDNMRYCFVRRHWWKFWLPAVWVTIEAVIQPDG